MGNWFHFCRNRCVDDMKYKEYLSIDDVNHRFINTNRKLKDKRHQGLKLLYLNKLSAYFLILEAKIQRNSRRCVWS